MRNVIAMTSKGTFTLPAQIRKSMGLRGKGDQLIIKFNPATKTAEISKPVDFRELQARTSKYAAQPKKPLLEVSDFYQKTRERSG